jgi:translocation and assembly module TamB
MSRTRKIITIAAASLGGLILLTLIAAVIVLQTGWFRGFVRDKIVSATQESTGGRVELGSFDFDLWHLRAAMNGFVLHGTESASAPPLFAAKRVQVDLRLFSGLKQAIGLRSLAVDEPRANVIVNPDGTTNLPTPKVKSQSNESALETVVDLAIGHFELRNGTVRFADRPMPLDARGENLRAQLDFNRVTQSYQGQVAMAPLYVNYARNAPLKIDVTLPVTIERDRLAFNNAKLATPESEIVLSAAVEHLASPRISGHANARLALSELGRAAGMKVPAQAARNLPPAATADIAFNMTDQRIQVSSARVAWGGSNIEASGLLKDGSGNPPGLQLRARVDIGQLAPLFSLEGAPAGVVKANGSAKLTGPSGYRFTGNVEAEDVAITEGGQRYSGIHFASAIDADQKRIALQGLRLEALGGQFAGNAALAKMSRFHADGQLLNFDLDTLARTFMGKPLGYSGAISGPVKVDGDLKAPGVTGIQADAELSLAPGRDGVPVSGRLNVQYNGADETVEIANSYVALPHSRLDLSGGLGKQLDVEFRSTNVNDFLPVMRLTSKTPVDAMPVALNGGAATFRGTITGSLTDPQVRGHLAAGRFGVEGRKFDQLAADVAASQAGASLANARLTRGGMRIQATANIGLHNWQALPQQPLKLNVTIRNGDAADLLALAGQPDIPVTGTLNAAVQLGGTVANPVGTAQATVTNGVAYQQPFSQAQANAGFSNQKVTLSSANITMPAGNAQLRGTFEHPADSFTTGRIHAQLNTTQMQLGELQAIVKQLPGLAGALQANANLSVSLNEVKGQTKFLIDAVDADLNVRGLKAEGQNYGDLTATARTNGATVDYRVNTDLAGSAIGVNGRTELRPDYPTAADASIQSLPIERLLALAGRKDIPARGTLSGSVRVSGTMKDLDATVDLALSKAVLYDEPLDREALRATYTGQSIDVPRLEIVAGPSRLEASMTYTHAPGDPDNGQARFQLSSNALALAQLHIIQTHRPGLAGTLQFAAKGAATVRKPPKGASAEVLVSTLDANVDATEIAVDRQRLGDLRLVARTSGDRVSYNLNSDFAGSKIEGHGQTALRAGYPTTAQISFGNVTYAGLRPLLAPEATAAPLFEAAVDGQASVDGPLTNPDALSARVTLSRLQVSSKAAPASGVQNVTLRNDAPIVIALDKSIVRIEHARIVGPRTDIVLAGTAGIDARNALDLAINANTNLDLLQQMSRSIFSSGAIVLRATIRGTASKPLVNGRLDLENTSFHYIDFPNGLSNLNGAIVFNGNNATIQSLTGESGGGKVSMSGFVSYGGATIAYGLKATTRAVRVRYPPGASLVAGVQLSLSGNTERSLLSGAVTIEKIGFNPQSDFGSLLSGTSNPPPAPSAPSGPIAGMRLDIAIRTAPDVTFDTALAQNLQATANLTVRGTADNPGMLGRITITQGDLVFFGSKYTVNQGSINFYDPTRIRPVLDIDLETVAKGVTVDLNVSGPIDDMKLTHRSDPPLQFNEIVALLATGRTPTSDPNLVAQQPATPPQTYQQMGESALVSQAIANPVSSRLQRVFGVSQLKIDPTFTSGSELPQARVTLQQQITSNITFTYITNVTQTNSEIVRIEWAVTPTWSAIATREETGRFGVDLFYKKSFR